jgi:hypothetical protein
MFISLLLLIIISLSSSYRKLITFSSNFIAYFVIYCHSDFYEFAVIPNMHSLTLMPSLAKSHCHCHEVSQYNNEHRDFAKFTVNSTVNKLGLEQKRKRRKV